MNESLVALLAVAVVALSALFVLTGSGTGMLAVDCVQVIAPTGIGRLYCGDVQAGSFRQFEGNAMDRRITRENVSPGIYRTEPLSIGGRGSGLFPQESYLEQRLERNV